MKKFLSVLLISLLCVCCLALGACKEEQSKSEIYKVTSIIILGEEYNVGDTLPAYFMGGVELTRETCVLEFKKDGKFVAKMNGEVSNDLTWTKEGNTYIIAQVIGSDTRTTICVVDGSIMTMEAEGGDVIYKLAKS